MKRIISNKKYDTETATNIAKCSNGRSGFERFEETLYRKKTGEYFLYGEGGPMSKYAESCGQNSWRGGSKIIPLNYENARKWAEDNLSADQYEEEFGEVTEDDSTTTLTLSMPRNVAETARRRAQESGMSLSGFLADLIRKA